jgi:RNA 2',3'-cyclic 3'-phosphodiesterase
VRAFVAVWPPPDVVRLLADIDRPARPGIRWTTEDQWHVTLQFLGEIDDRQVDGERASLNQMVSAGGVTPVVAVGGPSWEPLGSSILCLPVSGLEPLAAAVVAATPRLEGPAGPASAASVGERPFRGHVTIARAARGARRPWSATAVPCAASWVVDEITLVASTLHPAGARYRVIERFRLPGCP